jgi:triacylglycerol esterase/lipase EstA (alpha/beta hydrolase family)
VTKGVGVLAWARRGGVVLSLCLGLLLAAPLTGSAVAASGNLPVGTIVQGIVAQAVDPSGTPPGMNDWSCRLSAAHPYPVILLHGTLFNESLTWQALSPELANAGYCVFGLDYGAGPYTLGVDYGVGDIAASAGQLAQFVGAVRAATHATQVDIVGHSQGGMMPRYYMKFLGGARDVHMLVGLAPSNHGTTVDGADTLLGLLHGVGLDAFNLAGCVACTEQIEGQGSSFMATLNAGGDTVPGPQYVVIESAYDEVVTPFTSAFLNGPNVQNILLQAQCPLDFSEHIGIVYDPVALQDVLNALGPDDPSFSPACSLVPPVVG